MSPFDDKSIKRKIGSIFSDRDQFILRTFFYPFSVRFGYVEEDVAGFRRDLTEVKPMLEELFDFEKQVASDRDIDFATLEGSVGSEDDSSSVLDITNERNTIGVFGSGLVELLSREITIDLLNIVEKYRFLELIQGK